MLDQRGRTTASDNTLVTHDFSLYSIVMWKTTIIPKHQRRELHKGIDKMKIQVYTIKITEAAEKRLKRFDKDIQKRFASKIRKLSKNPEIHGKPLRKPLHGCWELRFEKSFRIIYTINRAAKTVTIEAIKHKDEF